MFAKGKVSSRVANDEPAKSPVADENIGAESEHEIRHIELARAKYGICQLVRGSSFEEEVGWATDTKSGISCEGLVTTESRMNGVARCIANAQRNSLRDETQLVAKVLSITCAGRGG